MKDYPVYDAHCHIFPLKIAVKATASIGDFYGIPMQEEGSSRELVRQAGLAGIEKCLVCSTATRAEQTGAINDFIAAQCSENAPLFYGFGTLHQDMPDDELYPEIDRICALGLHGIKLHPDFQKLYIDSPRMLPVYQVLAQKGLPVLFHMGDDRYDYSSPQRLANVLQAVPQLKAIAAHLGGYRAWDSAKCLARFDQVIFDCSSSLEMLSVSRAAEQIQLFGAQRVMFGSDFPMWKPKDVLQLVHALHLGDAQEELIFFRNFERYLLNDWK